ncbi:MAG: S-methyl-5-thioribose-1-phosphate isomerase [Vampirovibrionales bacterium]|nr:S-methyl-5-thioribose-1-phosphate isomerase [Vampirovibrionales bacterium]
MKLQGVATRSIMLADDGRSVRVLDQRQLPWRIVFETLDSLEKTQVAIQDMWVRGAPLIGATAAYGICLALSEDASTPRLHQAYERLLATRPTAINLRWALDEMFQVVEPLPPSERVAAAYARAAAICDKDVMLCQAMGRHGLAVIQAIAREKSATPKQPVNILTHCNAGWLATVDYGTALAPIYMAHDAGVAVHVWVDETRPRNQGASLTAFELAEHGVPHTVISDNAGGLLMQRNEVDLCIVGADRVTRNGDVCNKVGTYLKALAAYDNAVPFYVALPYTTIDPTMAQGSEIPIEERDPREVTTMSGQCEDGALRTVTLTRSSALNPAFDVTPARLVSGYITERGILQSDALLSL